MIDTGSLHVPPDAIDETLTPENAKEKGYLWVYDLKSTDGSLFNELDAVLLTEKGYKLGLCSDPMKRNLNSPPLIVCIAMSIYS